MSTWIHTALGGEYQIHPGDTWLNTYQLPEIAHSLAQINRFTGHASRPYSVAEHSLLVAAIAQSEGASPVLQLAALMHDAHEAYVGDMSSPVKWTVGAHWEHLEDHHALRLRQHFGLNCTFVSNRSKLKQWDLIALATERRDLLPYRPGHDKPWPILDTPGQEVRPFDTDLGTTIRSMAAWGTWLDAFLLKFHELQEQIKCPPNNPQA